MYESRVLRLVCSFTFCFTTAVSKPMGGNALEDFLASASDAQQNKDSPSHEDDEEVESTLLSSF